MTQELWLIIAGVVAPFVIELIKQAHTLMFGGELSSKAALTWTFILSIIFAVAIHFTSGAEIPVGGIEVVAPWVVAQLGIVMGIATTVYKFLISKRTRLV